MGEVIDFPLSETCHYSTGDGYIGVVNNSNDAAMYCHSGQAFIIFDGQEVEFGSRRELAEWLWMAAFLVDSEGRWQAKEYVGIDYET